MFIIIIIIIILKLQDCVTHFNDMRTGYSSHVKPRAKGATLENMFRLS